LGKGQTFVTRLAPQNSGRNARQQTQDKSRCETVTRSKRSVLVTLILSTTQVLDVWCRWPQLTPRASDSSLLRFMASVGTLTIESILCALFDHVFSTIKTNHRSTLSVVGVRTQFTITVLRVTRATVA
jgi:hypothetical protein